MEHHLPPLSSPSSEAAASTTARPLRAPHEPEATFAAPTVPLPLLLLVEPVVAVPVVPLSYGSGARGRAPLLPVARAPFCRRVLRVGPLSVVVEVVTPKNMEGLECVLATFELSQIADRFMPYMSSDPLSHLAKYSSASGDCSSGGDSL